jgi:hypothetical protein
MQACLNQHMLLQSAVMDYHRWISVWKKTAKLNCKPINQSIKNLTKVRVGPLVSCCVRAVPTCTLSVQPLLGKVSVVSNNTAIDSVVLEPLDGTTTRVAVIGNGKKAFQILVIVGWWRRRRRQHGAACCLFHFAIESLSIFWGIDAKNLIGSHSLRGGRYYKMFSGRALLLCCLCLICVWRRGGCQSGRFVQYVAIIVAPSVMLHI